MVGVAAGTVMTWESLSSLSARLSFPLHLSVAQNQAGVPPGQQRVGVPKVGVSSHWGSKSGFSGQCHSPTGLKLKAAGAVGHHPIPLVPLFSFLFILFVCSRQNLSL